jgi:hypothetical protein
MSSYFKEYALTLFAHRTMEDADVSDNAYAAKISYVRLYDSSDNYIQLPVCRNYAKYSALVFDDTPATQADAEYTDYTQDYVDLNLAVFVPRFNKDVSTSNVETYVTATFSVVSLKLFNEGGFEILSYSDMVSWDIAIGTRYMLRMVIRIYNDTVEQHDRENTRCIITEDGLRVAQRRLLHDGSKQKIGQAPNFIGVGAVGGYNIAHGSDRKLFYDDDGASYTNVSTELYPSSSAVDDWFGYCRAQASGVDGTTPDLIEGLDFDLNTVGVQNSDTVITWQYYSNDSVWVSLYGITDGTKGFTQSGTVRWLPPSDIQNATFNSSTGHWYRAIISGAGFTTEPAVTAATDIDVLVLETQSSESDLQLPFNRSMGDMVAIPYAGHAAKVSAEFGLGSIIEQYRDDGTLKSKNYQPIREIGIFTADGRVELEQLALGELTAMSISSGTMQIPNTNPRPLKLLKITDSNGKIFPASNLLAWVVNGSNWDTYISHVPDDTSEYDVTYLGERITPSSTPQNILSVVGNTQDFLAPTEIYLYSAFDNPADSDQKSDSVLTPYLIMARGTPGLSSPLTTPNIPANEGEGVLMKGSVYGTPSELLKEKFRKDFIGGIGWNQFFKWEGVWKYQRNFPVFLLSYDLSEYEDIDEATIYISMAGKAKDNFQYNVLVWGEGNPSGNAPKDRVTGWKWVGSSTPRPGDIEGATDVVISSIDMNWRWEPNSDNRLSPYLDEKKRMYVLLSPGSVTESGTVEVRENFESYVGGYRDTQDREKTKARKKARKQAHAIAESMRLNYAGVLVNPKQKTGDKAFAFRRGIDWTYVLGDAYAEWRTRRAQTAPVKTDDGDTFYPILPGMRLGKTTEKYTFEASPASATNIKLYTKYRPTFGFGQHRIWMVGEKNPPTTENKQIVIEEVGWDSTREWDEIESAYADDHSKGTSGEGAGYIEISIYDNATPPVAQKSWEAGDPRDIYVNYTYEKDPEILVSYIKSDGLMFARAHLSPAAFNTPGLPAYGDRFRIYFEVQYEFKRTA